MKLSGPLMAAQVLGRLLGRGGARGGRLRRSSRLWRRGAWGSIWVPRTCRGSALRDQPAGPCLGVSATCRSRGAAAGLEAPAPPCPSRQHPSGHPSQAPTAASRWCTGCQTGSKRPRRGARMACFVQAPGSPLRRFKAPSPLLNTLKPHSSADRPPDGPQGCFPVVAGRSGPVGALQPIAEELQKHGRPMEHRQACPSPTKIGALLAPNESQLGVA